MKAEDFHNYKAQ